MRAFTLLFSAFVLGTSATQAQTIATFDTLTLPKADTFYANYTASGSEVGFNCGHAHFPCIYDTSYGGIWTTGFAYTNMTDSVTSGYFNQYSAKAAKGFGGSANYLMAHCTDPVTYEPKMKIALIDSAAGRPVKGFYVTNSTYAYNSMITGDMFSKKFGNGDWFLLTIKGYHGGVLQPASVGVYLADFLFPDPSMNYILKTWKWVDVESLGNVDSLELSLTSSDNGMFGMNTPAYFCIDNFTTTDAPAVIPPTLAIANAVTATAKVYPNPAKDLLNIDRPDNSLQHITVTDITGAVVYSGNTATAHTEINTSTLPAGLYLLTLSGDKVTATTGFIKN
jgi:Domain of unknown function (DUF4465)/Secretion system C-terminal sorting domain